MAESGPTFNSLAAAITQATSTISSYIDEHKLPAPSFAENGPEIYPMAPEVQFARLELLDAATDLLHLALNNHDTMVMDVLNQFEFWSAVPAGGSATYGEIVQATKLPEEVVRHILRYAFAMRLFAPVGRDSVKHTATSAYISRTPPTRTMIAHNAEEVRISDYCFPESLRRFSLGKPTLSQEINESGWASLMSTRPAAAAVAGVGVHEYLRDNYDWASLGEAKVINYVVKILENIAPHLKSGSRLVMFETVFPSLDAECKYPLPGAAMRILAATDLQMLSFANAVERTLEEWRAVIKKADERFDVWVISSSPESLRSIMRLCTN
ncbi:O-methyltransferase [Talaromyces pinophilus]|uniref:O-methyltransferase n=1 Tax=Talaromyces pinophilus TaxID=128442 RepID=A0A0B8N4A9_TALPI|nr:O-methyltransferase [Talaromyces pinophilus]